MELALTVEAQDVLEDPRRSVEIELSTDEAEGVTKREDLRYRKRCSDVYNNNNLTLSSCISEPLKSAIRKFINGVPFYLMDRPAHIQNHYAFIEAWLICA